MSSKKVWYLFLENHHKGPYTLNEIDSLILQGLVDHDVPIWKEGMDGWVSHATLSKHLREPDGDFVSAPDIPEHLNLDYIEIPDLPADARKEWKRTNPKPESEDLKPKEKPQEKSGGQQGEKTDAPLPRKPKVTRPQEEFSKSPAKSETTGHLVELDSVPTTVKPIKVNKDLQQMLNTNRLTIFPLVAKALLVMLILSAIGMGAGFFYLKSLRDFSRPQGISIADHRRLSDVSKSDGDISVEFAFSKDMSSIWMASNYRFNSSLSLKVESIDGEMLGDHKVSFTSQGFFNHGLVKFSKMAYLKGDRMLSGRYKFEVIGERAPKLLWWQGIFRHQVVPLRENKKVLVGFATEHSYKSALRKYNNRYLKEKIGLLTELEYKYQTLVAVGSQLKEKIDKLIRARGTKRAVRIFEKSYEIEIGTFLTNLTSQNQGELAIKFEKYSEYTPAYEALFAIAGQLGNSSMEIIAGIKKYRRLNKARRTRFYRMTEDRMNGVKKSCYERIYQIQGYLQDLKASLVE